MPMPTFTRPHTGPVSALIGTETGYSRTVSDYDIYAFAGISGDNHPNYSGGERVYPPEFNNELRRKIRARDNHACQICGVTQRNLCVHHIDCDKSNNAETNLISLCRSCHMHVHGYIRRTGKIYEFTASS